MHQPYPSDPPRPSGYTAALVTTGILALLGFTLPILVGERLVFLNVEAFRNEAPIPGFIKFLFLYPLLAGIFIIVVSTAARGLSRGITLLGLGLLTLALQIAGASEFSNVMAPAVLKFPGNAQFLILAILTGFAGWSMLYAGALVSSISPSSRLPKVIAGVGGGVFLLHLLLPVLPTEAGSLLIVTPIKALARGGIEGPALGMFVIVLLSMVFNLTASVMGCVLAGTGPQSRGLSRTTGILARIGIFCLLLFPLVVTAVAPNMHPTERLYTAVLIAKLLCWNIGIFAVLPFGLADLLLSIVTVSSSRRPPCPEPARPPFTGQGYPPGYGEIPVTWPEHPAPPPPRGTYTPVPGAWANYPPAPGGGHPASPPPARPGWPSPAGQPAHPPHPAPRPGPVPGGYPYPPQGQGPIPAQAPPPQDPRVAELQNLFARGLITREEYNRRLRELR